MNQERLTSETFSSARSGQEEYFSVGEQDELSSVESIDQEMILEQILSDPGVMQHWTRRRNAEAETLNVFFRCPFAVNQQRFILHIPFVPSFEAIPEVICNLVDDCPGRIKVTDRQKFGARLELVLDRPASDPISVLIEVTAAVSY